MLQRALILSFINKALEKCLIKPQNSITYVEKRKFTNIIILKKNKGEKRKEKGCRRNYL